MRKKVNRVLRTAVGDTALLPCRKDLCDGEMPAVLLRQILWPVVPLWNVLMSGTGHSRDDDRGMDGRDCFATGHSSPDHDLFAIRFSIFLLHRFASNVIIY